ncbi:hypothetical protein [Maribacter luteus]|nr:hypothetical protein [Maribacter luteus]
MYKKYLLSIVLVLWMYVINFSIFAQPNGGGGSQAVAKQQGFNRGLESLYRTLEDKNKRNTGLLDLNNDIEGSPFFDENFIKGSVYFKNDYMGESYLRYNAYSEEIQIKKTQLEEEEFGALLKDPDLYCIIDSKKLKFLEYKDADGNLKRGYFTTLVSSGKYFLFVKRVKLFKKGKSAPTSLTAAISPKFIDKIDYYFMKEDSGKLYKVVHNKNKFVSLFGKDYKNRIKSFMRKNKIDLKKESDLLTLFYYINTLT